MTSYFTESKQTTGSEEEEYYFLQPMFQKLPPNEILSEKYAPDVTTQIRFISSKDERKNNLHFIPPKSKNAELQTYAESFNMFDYLGKQYADKINQVVYFKFNNTKYNIVPEQKLKTRIMPAFYVPFQQIYSQNQTLFTKNIGLTFPETSNNSSLPSSKNNRGCSFDPIFCSTYQSANLFAAIRKNPFEYDLILQNDINSCEQVSWFNFSVQFTQQGYYSFRIVNFTEDMSKIYESGMKISYYYLNPGYNKFKKSGEGWGLCGENIKFSKSNIDNEYKKGKKYYELYFQFKCKNKHDIVMFSFDVPYSILEYEKYFNKILYKKIKNMLNIEKKVFGKTMSGSPLVSYQISRKKSKGESIKISPQSSSIQLENKEKRKSVNLTPINQLSNINEMHKSIIIIGRLQGSDTNSSLIIEGMIDYLLDSMEVESMKRLFDFYFIPLANIDAVKYGNSKTNLTGSLLNNNWKTPHRFFQAEIFNLKQYLQQINKQSPISLIINLNSQKQDIYSSFIGVKNAHEQVEDSRIFPFIMSRRNKIISFEKSLFYNRNQNNSMCCVLNEHFSKALIYQLNVSHFQALKRYDESIYASRLIETEIRQSTSENYRVFGKDLLSYYLQHTKLYEKNMLLRSKWIKQIEQIQPKINKRLSSFVEDRKVQEKFAISFYQINHSQQFSIAPQIKTAKAFMSSNLLNSQKKIDLDRIFNMNFKRQRSYRNLLPNSRHEYTSKRNKKEDRSNTKLQLTNLHKKFDFSENDLQKISAFMKNGQKKTSILLNCPSNTFNFDLQPEKKLNFAVGKRERNAAQKEVLRKELSTKFTRKIKIQDSLNRWNAKDRTNKNEQYLNNS